jgi:hypothetical protein
MVLKSIKCMNIQSILFLQKWENTGNKGNRLFVWGLYLLRLLFVEKVVGGVLKSFINISHWLNNVVVLLGRDGCTSFVAHLPTFWFLSTLLPLFLFVLRWLELLLIAVFLAGHRLSLFSNWLLLTWSGLIHTGKLLSRLLNESSVLSLRLYWSVYDIRNARNLYRLPRLNNIGLRNRSALNRCSGRLNDWHLCLAWIKMPLTVAWGVDRGGSRHN